MKYFKDIGRLPGVIPYEWEELTHIESLELSKDIYVVKESHVFLEQGDLLIMRAWDNNNIAHYFLYERDSEIPVLIRL